MRNEAGKETQFVLPEEMRNSVKQQGVQSGVEKQYLQFAPGCRISGKCRLDILSERSEQFNVLRTVSCLLLEKPGGEIPLTGIRKNHNDELAYVLFSECDLQCCPCSGARGYAC